MMKIVKWALVIEFIDLISSKLLIAAINLFAIKSKVLRKVLN